MLTAKRRWSVGTCDQTASSCPVQDDRAHELLRVVAALLSVKADESSTNRVAAPKRRPGPAWPRAVALLKARQACALEHAGTCEYDESRWPTCRRVSRTRSSITKPSSAPCTPDDVPWATPCAGVRHRAGRSSSLSVAQRERIGVMNVESSRADRAVSCAAGRWSRAHCLSSASMIRARIFWLVHSPSPTEAFSSVESALDLALRLLVEQQI